MAVRLTQRSSGAGCAVKFPPDALFDLISSSPLVDQVGWVFDDSAIIGLDSGLQLLHSVDLVTPMVDDPYLWGQITANHALSDIYAMGGIPISAANLLGLPRDLDPTIARDVLRGGLDFCRAAGCQVRGGHTFFDEEPKFGLSVIGLLTGFGLRLNAGKPGDRLTLTKPIGAGVLTTYGSATGNIAPEAVESMLASNEGAMRLALASGARCATDVTGFGLIGQLIQVARQSGVTAVIGSDSVPLIPTAYDVASQGYVSGGTMRNYNWARDQVHWEGEISETTRLLLCDSQAAGGLIVAGPAMAGWHIGDLIASTDKPVLVR